MSGLPRQWSQRERQILDAAEDLLLAGGSDAELRDRLKQALAWEEDLTGHSWPSVREVARDALTRACRRYLRLSDAPLAEASLPAALESLARGIADTTRSPVTRALRRAVEARAADMPDLSDAFWDHGFGRQVDIAEETLQRFGTANGLAQRQRRPAAFLFVSMARRPEGRKAAELFAEMIAADR